VDENELAEAADAELRFVCVRLGGGRESIVSWVFDGGCCCCCALARCSSSRCRRRISSS
jgi:hypothetical protein